MNPNQPLIDYLNSVKASNNENIVTLNQQIDGANATIANLNTAISGQQDSITQNQNAIDNYNANNILIEDIIALLQ